MRLICSSCGEAWTDADRCGHEHMRQEIDRLRAEVGRLKTTTGGIFFETLMKENAALKERIEEDRLLTQEIDSLTNRNAKLRDIIRRLGSQDDGGCWCEMRTGNPMAQSHSGACKAAGEALRSKEKETT